MNSAWGICGIGAMASDQKLIDSLKAQDFLYSVSMSDAEKNDLVAYLKTL